MSVSLKVGELLCSGLTRFVVLDGSGRKKIDTGYQNNMLLNNFFSMATGFDSDVKGVVGTGNLPPNEDDTTLGSQLGASSANSVDSGVVVIDGDSAAGYALTTKEKVMTWPTGAIVGNISEYGVVTNYNGSLIVKNLIKDSNGTPTTISLTADDQLQLWWKLKKKAVGANDVSNSTASYVLDGVATDVTIKQINPSYFSGVNVIDQAIRPLLIGSSNAVLHQVVTSSGAAADVLNANSGDDLNYLPIAAEQNSGYKGWSKSTPSPGVSRLSISFTLGINGSASESETTFLAMSLSTSLFASEILAVLEFSPRFVKGVDKVLSASFYYDMVRA